MHALVEIGGVLVEYRWGTSEKNKGVRVVQGSRNSRDRNPVRLQKMTA